MLTVSHQMRKKSRHLAEFSHDEAVEADGIEAYADFAMTMSLKEQFAAGLRDAIRTAKEGGTSYTELASRAGDVLIVIPVDSESALDRPQKRRTPRTEPTPTSPRFQARILCTDPNESPRNREKLLAGSSWRALAGAPFSLGDKGKATNVQAILQERQTERLLWLRQACHCLVARGIACHRAWTEESTKTKATRPPAEWLLDSRIRHVQEYAKNPTTATPADAF